MADPSVMLASASPRRRALLHELLEHHGWALNTMAVDLDEDALLAGVDPGLGVARVARAKLSAALESMPTALEGTRRIVIAADTVVVAPDGAAVGKPVDAADAERMIRAFSAETITVLTALAIDNDGHLTEDVVETSVRMTAIDDASISAYLATDIPWDKAGALELQGASARFVSRVDGCFTNVVGVPVCRVAYRLGLGGGGCTCEAPVGPRSKLTAAPPAGDVATAT